MARLVLFLALCILPAMVTARSMGNPFLVRGRVYCDTCRAGFETNVTNYLPGAKVKIECRDRDAQVLTYSIEGKTDSTGTYNIVVAYDHEDQCCDAVLVSSPDPECSVPNRGRDRARVILTRSNGMIADTRFANNMGFLKRRPLPGCAKLLQYYLGSDDE